MYSGDFNLSWASKLFEDLGERMKEDVDNMKIDLLKEVEKHYHSFPYFPFISKEEQDDEIIKWLIEGYRQHAKLDIEVEPAPFGNPWRHKITMEWTSDSPSMKTNKKETEMLKHSDLIESQIQSSIKEWNEHPKDVISDYEVMGLGELIERLAIANLKLFKEKNAQADNDLARTNEWFRESVKRDVELCKERAKLKNAIDKKIIAMISSGENASSNRFEEMKNYGN